MKKIVLLLISVLALGACEKDLDLAPISDPGSNGFYKNAADFKQAVNGIYATFGVQTVGTTNTVDYASLYVVLDESRSDNIYTPGQAGVRDWNNINNFQKTLATLGTISNTWNLTFNGVMRANTVLDQLAVNRGAVGDPALATRFEAEARFLRAYFYFDLVKWFGKVPIFEKLVTPSEALSIGRSSVEDVYSLIIADLNFAVANLPAEYGAADKGRATSLAAKGILARVYLTRSGPKLHPDGPCLASNEYTLAYNLLNEIIQSNKFGMLTNYASIFDYNNEGNSEIIFDFQFISGGLGAGGYFPTEYFDEGWGRVNLPFPGGNPGDGSKRISDDLLNSYDAADLRIDPTFQFDYTDINGMTADAQFFDKFMNKAKAGGDRFDWSINYPVLRYTDVLMLKAECILQGANGTQGDVDKIVNDVRMRAGLTPVSGVTLDMLLAERRKEFAGENLRWDDLVRTGKVVDVMNAWRVAEDASGKIEPVTADFIIYPIPSNQLDVKPGLYTQNPGYL